jgi:hypothetical protein
VKDVIARALGPKVRGVIKVDEASDGGFAAQVKYAVVKLVFRFHK